MHLCNPLLILINYALVAIVVAIPSSFYTKVQGPINVLYLVFNLSWICVIAEFLFIVTELQFVLGYPLRRMITALRCYTCHFSVRTVQINLEPVTGIIADS